MKKYFEYCKEKNNLPDAERAAERAAGGAAEGTAGPAGRQSISVMNLWNGVVREMNRTVKVRDLVIGEGMPKICVPVVASDEETLVKALDHLKGASYDMVEFRADYMIAGEGKKAEGKTAEAGAFAGLLGGALERIREITGNTPVLFTFRTKAEGGSCEASHRFYEELLLWAAGSGLADLVDLEYDAAGDYRSELIGKIHAHGVYVIGSRHHFNETPSVEEMTGILRKMQEAGMDITKLAVMPSCRQDVLRLMEASVLMAESLADRPFITMSMGSMGRVSRVAGSLTGSAVTFACAGAASAPGQIGSELMKEILAQLS